MFEVTVGGCQINGEIYAVSPEMLQRLDELEGIATGFYVRKEISLTKSSGDSIRAWCYLKHNPSAELRALQKHDTYTKELHAQYVRPDMRHADDATSGYATSQRDAQR